MFIDDLQFKTLWLKPERSYIVANQSVVPQLESLVGAEHLSLVAESGGKVVVTNHPLAVSRVDPPNAIGGVNKVAQLSKARSVQ